MSGKVAFELPLSGVLRLGGLGGSSSRRSRPTPGTSRPQGPSRDTSSAWKYDELVLGLDNDCPCVKLEDIFSILSGRCK